MVVKPLSRAEATKLEELRIKKAQDYTESQIDEALKAKMKNDPIDTEYIIHIAYNYDLMEAEMRKVFALYTQDWNVKAEQEIVRGGSGWKLTFLVKDIS